MTTSTSAKEALRTSLKEARSPSDTGAYSIALGIAKDTESRDLLIQKLRKAPGEEAKGNVAVALGLIDARDAIEDIRTIVVDSKYKPELLKQAAIGLGPSGTRISCRR